MQEIKCPNCGKVFSVDDPIIISRIDVKYNRIQIIDCMTDPSIESHDNFVVELGEKKRVYFSSDKFLAASSEHDNKPHSLKVTITDYQGRHYTVKRPFTHSDMLLKSFPERFFSLVK